MTNKIAKLFAVLAMIANFAGQSAHAELALDVRASEYPSIIATCDGQCGTNGRMWGWDFYLTSAITIDGLGAWRMANTELTNVVTVGIWDIGQNLVASAAVSSRSQATPSAESASGWLIEPINQTTLAPFKRYTIGALLLEGTVVRAAFAHDYTLNPSIQWLNGLNDAYNTGFIAPTVQQSYMLLGPTMRIAPPVPEPSSSVLMLAGLLVFGVAARRRKKR